MNGCRRVVGGWSNWNVETCHRVFGKGKTHGVFPLFFLHFLSVLVLMLLYALILVRRQVLLLFRGFIANTIVPGKNVFCRIFFDKKTRCFLQRRLNPLVAGDE